NEEKTVTKLLRKLFSTKFPIKQIEYIIVDDGSTDASASKISNFKFPVSKYKFIKHTKNQGKGAAVKTGLQKAKGDYAIIQDADLEYDPKDILALLQPVIEGKANIVYGTRLKRLPNFKRDERNMRFFIQYLGNKFLSFTTS